MFRRVIPLEFIENVFIDDSIKDLNTVLYSLKKGIPLYNVYVILVDDKNANWYAQIMSSSQFFINESKFENYKVIGLAQSKAKANELFSSILGYWLENDNELAEFKKGIAQE